MEMTRRNQVIEELEALVDAEGIVIIIELLSELCSEKAEHLRTNWQCESTARLWDRYARDLNRAADRLHRK